MSIRCKEFANLIVPSTDRNNISDTATLLYVYKVMVISGWANKITAYRIRDERMRR